MTTHAHSHGPCAASDGPADRGGTWATREGHLAAERARGVLESARQTKGGA